MTSNTSAKTGKTALITCLFLKSRTGSELHTLEMARQLQSRGWQVTCFTLLSAYPILDDFLEAGIRVVTFEEADTLDSHYDLFFAQHHLVSDYVYQCLDISFGHVVVSILGAASEHELLPALIDSADMAVFVSEECRDAYASELPSGLPTLVFPNYASREFFDLKPRRRRNIERIAVVSNHTPDEVKGLRDVVPKNVEVVYFGYESLSIPITPELLDSFDVVISIGRTAQLCMATSTPFYCYDIFGGPGYLEVTRLNAHARMNFSGRSDPTKRTPSELWEDLSKGYHKALLRLMPLRHFASQNANLDSLVSNLLRRIKAAKPRRRIKSRSTAVKSKMACASLVKDYPYQEEFATVQVFYGNRVDPVLEERSVLLRVRYNSLTTVHYEHIIPANPDFYPLRLDPSFNPCQCLMRTEGIVPAEGSQRGQDGWDVLNIADPSYFYPSELTNEQHQQPLVFAVRPLEV